MIYIDPPTWPGHGRLWSHLISDVSYDELHDFAARIGIPRRAFERDHYDVVEERYAAAVAAGADEVRSREIVRLLTAAGLRRRKISHPKTSHPKTSHPKTSHPKTSHPKTSHPKTSHPKIGHPKTP